MRTLLQINTTLNYGSTGRIAESLGMMAKKRGWRSVIAHGPRMKNPSKLDAIEISSRFEEKIHGLMYSRFLDRHGLGSTSATRDFIKLIDTEIKPDLIHIHNLHGYYINYKILFEYLVNIDVPVVWTFHDCWPFTGHCANFDAVGCEKWKLTCRNCKSLRSYPSSFFLDNSQRNFNLKKKLFNSLGDRLTIVPVSKWLEALVKKSFLKNCRTQVIHNGVDIDIFQPMALDKQKIVLGVAAPWTKEKGLYDFYELRKLLSDDYKIMLVGLSEQQIIELPSGIIGIARTQNQQELAEIYSQASVFVNPTYQDNYPTTNLEAMACGTPVITYNTGGSPEAITSCTGAVVEKGDFTTMTEEIRRLSEDSAEIASKCRERAVSFFDKDKCFSDYMSLYAQLLNRVDVYQNSKLTH